ncbi:flagellar M-ring protein FliF [Halomonas sp. MCCC 1A17488]|uniref:flagellar basal-body MS-ring/collar protein FliF n=1 Tax=unclassified Halomonas TaxID=2609666 RepID=UPI0018D24D93|nr:MULTISPECIES: flagellar basal-body MS-ring/collar protein FliF [unclassified Halomonas]MCE8014800.1 flagellar M-ring protein FliF [Halomonas sp. MCCC 1A17488]MCG3238133.1 flagellar M-ring protein FliF [Halomonas sp. MCCC 1A17488]QPP48099.1 flagellar M-ring protein FliF [Halomonas sp. SS10-MC5]
MSNGATTQERQASPGSGSSAALLERLQQQFRGNPLIAVLIGGAAMIAIVVALLMWAREPEYRVLYSNLTEADGGRIISELDSRGVPYRFSEGGTALLVPGDSVHSLRLQLAEQGLPRGGNVGFELMDSQAFGVSQFAEQVNYQRGLEGELSRSIESLGPVERARVHLAMAKSSVFVRDREPAKASIIVTLEPGRVMGESQVAAIVHMVSSSVPDLAAENVTVVDHSGRMLSMPNSQGRGLDATQLDYIAEVERSFQQRIENILAPILGRDSISAQVAAQIDFSRREETSERYGPNQPPNEAAVRSRQTSLSYNGDDGVARGIPGALSNTPPGVAPSPIELPTDEEGELTEEAEQSLRALNNLSQDDVINYEVDRNVQHIQHRQGQVTRLTAAVVVDYREERDENGEWQRVALSEAEIAQIERLVRQAIGFSQARGDAIEVVNSPFSRVVEESEELEWWQSPEIHALALTAGRYLLVALGILLGYLLILRPLIKRHTERPVLAAAPGTGLQVRVGDDAEASEGELQAAGGEDDELRPYQKPKRKRRSSAYEDHLAELRELAQEDPRMIAMIVRSWMNKE